MPDVIISPAPEAAPGPDFATWEQSRSGTPAPAASEAASNDGGSGEGEGGAAAAGEGEQAASESAVVDPQEATTEEELAPASEPDEEQELAALREEAEKKGISKRLLKALDKQTARYYGEKAQRELLEKQLNGKPAAPAGGDSTATSGAETQTATPPNGQTWSGKPEPKPEDFDTYDKYIKGLGEWAAAETIAKARIEDQNRGAVERVNRAMTRYVKEVPHAEFPDWNETINAAAQQGAELTPTMAYRVFESGQPGGDPNYALGYYLGKHPDETKRIAALPPVEQAMELRFIEGQLARKAGAPTLKRNPAPRAAAKPPETVNAGAAPPPTPRNTSELPADADFAAYERVRGSQKKK